MEDVNGDLKQTEISFTHEKRLDYYLIDSINSASKTIRVAIFIFEWEPLCDALINAAKRGVEVEIITDVRSIYLISKPNGSTSVPDLFYKNNIDVLIYDDRPFIMHQKFMIIDNKYILSGSYNFQEAATLRNRENIIKVVDKHLIIKINNELNDLKNFSYKFSEHELKKLKPISAGKIWVEFRFILAITFIISLLLNFVLSIIIYIF